LSPAGSGWGAMWPSGWLAWALPRFFRPGSTGKVA
jgi:hypothetical protein